VYYFNPNNAATCISVYRRGFGFLIEFIQLIQIITYKRFATSHIFQFTRAHTACCVFTRDLATVSNGTRSSSCGFPNCPRPQVLPCCNSNNSRRLYRSNSLTSLISPAYIISARTTQKTPFLCCRTTVALMSVEVPT
jgi:hypothetical protein